MKIILVLNVILVLCSAQRFKGDSCKVSATGNQGQCKLISECQAAIQGIQQGSQPTTCGFEGAVPIVCCAEQTVREKRTPGEISKKKCKEYAQYVWEVENAVVQLKEVKPRKIYTCWNTAVPRIIGGTKAGYREFPHMARIGFQDKDEILYKCGGSIISESYILTAAHCLIDIYLGEPVQAAIGMLNLQDKTRQIVNIIKLINHPKFTRRSKYNDIGLLKIEGAIMNSYARPACLYTAIQIHHKEAIAIGWGKVGYTDEQSKDLQKVTLDLYNHTKCNYTGYSSLAKGFLDDIQICAGSTNYDKDTAPGDSGGPLQIYHNEKSDGAKCMYDLIGITSNGDNYGVNQKPTIYTKISAYIQWIEDIVWP